MIVAGVVVMRRGSAKVVKSEAGEQIAVSVRGVAVLVNVGWRLSVIHGVGRSVGAVSTSVCYVTGRVVGIGVV